MEEEYRKKINGLQNRFVDLVALSKGGRGEVVQGAIPTYISCHWKLSSLCVVTIAMIAVYNFVHKMDSISLVR